MGTSSSAVGTRIEAPKAPREWGVGRGVPLPAEVGVWAPEKKSDFGSQMGEFWCKLGAFCTVHLKLV